MKPPFIPLAAIGAIAAAILIPFFARTNVNAQETAAWSGKKWEYRVLRITDRRTTARTSEGRGSASEQALNELGTQGWELVSVRNDGSSQPVFYFKRPKS